MWCISNVPYGKDEQLKGTRGPIFRTLKYSRPKQKKKDH